MTTDEVTFPLAPVYARQGITYHQAEAIELHPEGDDRHGRPYVVAESAVSGTHGERLDYDSMINATGPRLNFGVTPGLGPGAHSSSVCTAEHAAETSATVDMIVHGAKEPTRDASMARLGGACVASAGAHPWSGTAAAMTMYPIVPDDERYPDTGRDTRQTTSEAHRADDLPRDAGLRAAHAVRALLADVRVVAARALRDHQSAHDRHDREVARHQAPAASLTRRSHRPAERW